MSIFKKIGDWFSHIFQGAKQTWEKVSPEVQSALIQGSTIVALINKYRSETPQFVIDLMEKKGIPVDKALEVLNKYSSYIGVAQDINNPDILTTVSNLQQYFDKVKPQGKVWAILSHSAAGLISVFLAPPATKVASIVSLLEYVYQEIVKPDVEAPVETPVQDTPSEETAAA